MRPDIVTSDFGSFVQISPVTGKARNFLRKHYRHATHMGEGIAVEHRYAYDVLNGMLDVGLVLQRAEDGAIAGR